MKIKFYQLALLLMLGISLPQLSFAAQEKWVKDNNVAQAFISIKGLTRLAVEYDRIQDVRGPEGAYQIKADVNQGAVFIQPTEDFEKKPFTIFLATEQNHNYVLHLIPRDQNADTILLKPQDARNPAAVRWETASPYTEAVTQLMGAIVNQTAPEGYAIDVVTHAANQTVGHDLYLKLVKTYQGAYLQGLIYSVTNRTNQTIVLTESEFYQAGDRAIALSNPVLAPHSQIWLLKVQNHG